MGFIKDFINDAVMYYSRKDIENEIESIDPKNCCSKFSVAGYIDDNGYNDLGSDYVVESDEKVKARRDRYEYLIKHKEEAIQKLYNERKLT